MTSDGQRGKSLLTGKVPEFDYFNDIITHLLIIGIVPFRASFLQAPEGLASLTGDTDNISARLSFIGNS